MRSSRYRLISLSRPFAQVAWLGVGIGWGTNDRTWCVIVTFWQWMLCVGPHLRLRTDAEREALRGMETIRPVRVCTECRRSPGGSAKPNRAPSPAAPVMANVPVCSICGVTVCEVEHVEA